MKVGIFTTNSVDKLHPRIEMQQKILSDAGFDVTIIRSKANREGFFYELINLLSLKYFKWRFIWQSKKRLSEFDIIHIYDFRLLPLAKKASRAKKIVVYETLDDNIYLNFFEVAKRLKFMTFFERSIIRRYSNYERNIADKYCNAVIVNSPNLIENFTNASLIYYSSHLENIRVEPFDETKKSAFIYLGKLTKAKGAEVYSELLDKFQIPLFVLGKASDKEAMTLIDRDDVIALGNFTSEGLIIELAKLMSNFNLIGLSIIFPENKSYALQEANKDIDYMSMGLPFLGNDRIPTKKKIDAGAGVLYSDYSSVADLLTNASQRYDFCREKALSIYHEQFSQEKFEISLLAIYQSLR